VSKGFDLNDMGQLMKFLHALQAQVLIDMAQRAAALMGEPAHSYVEAGVALARRGVFSPEDLRLYRAVVGFRNVLVHGYISVDTLRISQILAGREYRKLADLAITGVQLLLGKTLRVRGGRLRPFLNALMGFTDALLDTAASFAVARVFIGEIEALIPALRTVEAASSVALKQKIVVGDVFAGLGAFLGQRAVSCGRSLLVTRAVAAAMLGSAVYVLLS
jgi:uncharacterized protein YutE (UPF0331/DUF86 family)